METLPAHLLEAQPQRSAIHFEPGDNEFINEASKGFNRGNLDAHVWNTEVGERIASYAYNAPAIALAIDSVGSEPPNTLYATSSQQQADAVQR